MSRPPRTPPANVYRKADFREEAVRVFAQVRLIEGNQLGAPGGPSEPER